MSVSIFPAKASVIDSSDNGVIHAEPIQQWPKVRVRTSNDIDRVQVWLRDERYPHTPMCVLDEPIVGVVTGYNQWAPLAERIAEFAIPGGRVLKAATLAGDCGCGSPLRSLPQWTAESQVKKQESVSA